EAITAQRIAQAEHVKARHHAKVVMIKSGDQHLMVVLPADHRIDLDKIKRQPAKPRRSTLNKNSSRCSRIARLERCRHLAISIVCQPMWISVWRRKITLFLKPARTPMRSNLVIAIMRRS